MTHILYVEDDPFSRDVVRMAQRMSPDISGLTVFDDSRDFEHKLLELQPQPDLILLDIHMKPFSGFEMLKMIRSHAEFDRTYVVALTASVMNEEVRMLQEAGFQGGISKPLHLEIFPELIQRIMNGERIWHVW